MKNLILSILIFILSLNALSTEQMVVDELEKHSDEKKSLLGSLQDEIVLNDKFIPTDLVIRIAELVGPFGRTELWHVSKKWRDFLNMTQAPIEYRGLGWTDLLTPLKNLQRTRINVFPSDIKEWPNTIKNIFSVSYHVARSRKASITNFICHNPEFTTLTIFQHNCPNTIEYRGHIYIASYRDIVSVIDISTLAVIDEFEGNCLLAYGEHLYMIKRDGSLSIRALAENYREIKNIPIGKVALPLLAFENYIFVINVNERSNSTVSIINIAADHEVIKTIQIGREAKHPLISGAYLFIVNTRDDSLSIIELSRLSLIDTVEIGPVYELCACNDKYLCVLNKKSWNHNVPGKILTVVDIEQHFRTKIIRLDFAPKEGLLSHGAYLYLTDNIGGVIACIDPSASRVTYIRAGRDPQKALSYGPYIFVANTKSWSVTVIDPLGNFQAKSFDVGICPEELILFADSLFIIGESKATVLDLGGFAK